MLRYKKDVLGELKEKGYNSNLIRKTKLIGQSQLQQIRSGEVVSKEVLNLLCYLLDCQIGDIIEYVPDDKEIAVYRSKIEQKDSQGDS